MLGGVRHHGAVDEVKIAFGAGAADAREIVIGGAWGDLQKMKGDAPENRHLVHLGAQGRFRNLAETGNGWIGNEA